MTLKLQALLFLCLFFVLSRGHTSEFDYSQPFRNVELTEALNLVSKSSLGSKLAKFANDEIQKGELKIIDYSELPEWKRKKIPRSFGTSFALRIPPNHFGDGDPSTILLKMDREVGAVTLVLIHEITHVIYGPNSEYKAMLSESLQLKRERDKELEKPLSSRDHAKLDSLYSRLAQLEQLATYNTEFVAFLAVETILRELATSYLEFVTYFREANERLNLRHKDPISEMGNYELMEGYRLDPVNLRSAVSLGYKRETDLSYIESALQSTMAN